MLDHGTSGSFAFLKSVGDGYLDLKDVRNDKEVEEFFQFLASFVKTKAAGGRIDLMACSTAAGPRGQELLAHLEQRTGVTWAASTDETGAGQDAEDGFDWVLESHGIDVSELYFCPGSLTSWLYTLGSLTVDDGFASLTLDKDDQALIDIVNECSDRYLKQLDDVEAYFHAFVDRREQTTESLWDLVKELEAARRGTDVGSLISSSMAVTASVLGLGAAAMFSAPFTGGTSLLAWGAAAGSASVGMASLGASAAIISDHVLAEKVKEVVQKQKEIMDDDGVAHKHALAALTSLTKEEGAIKDTLRKRVKVIDAQTALRIVKDTAKLSKRLKAKWTSGLKGTTKSFQTMCHEIGRYKVISARHGRKVVPFTAQNFFELDFLDSILKKQGEIKLKGIGTLPDFRDHIKEPEGVAKFMSGMAPIAEAAGFANNISDLYSIITKMTADKPVEAAASVMLMACQLDLQRLLLTEMVKAASDGAVFFEYVFFKNEKSGQVMSVEDAKDEDGARVCQREYVGNPDQIFRHSSRQIIMSMMPGRRALDAKGTNPITQGSPLSIYSNFGTPTQLFYTTLEGRIESFAAEEELFVDVKASSTAKGAKLQLSRSNGESHQRWKVITSDRGYIRCVESGLALGLEDDDNSASSGGRKLAMITRLTHGGDALRWIFHQDGTIENIETKLLLDIEEQRKINGALAVLTPRHGGPSQKWELTNNLEIYSPYADKVLDVKGHGMVEGTTIFLWTKTNKANQQFIYRPWMT
eukprot:TRINITY_DN92291_c0_g1_i1.p1 TRINITY_DN92291_c0_g1~~TRINITY_DN92291_c0_g1_i1.p1  ORF type:complete len:855 (-),score=142.21 TRINITY_DN92291_c0_g1_i1:209-2470(-)